MFPAVLHYYDRSSPGRPDGAVRFLLTAGAIGILYKQNASISGAEGRMPGGSRGGLLDGRGALAEVLGGTPEQVENAARKSAWNTTWG